MIGQISSKLNKVNKLLTLVNRNQCWSLNKLCNYSTEIDRNNLHKKETLQIEFETGDLIMNSGDLARLSTSSAIGKIGNTSVLVAIVSRFKQGVFSFAPLTVEYLHKTSAFGKIPGNFTRRQIGLSNYEILVSRMIDRSLRPLFPIGYNNEVQIICNLLEYDGQHAPDVIAINTASYALFTSNLYWNGPVASVRVGYLNDKFIINPTRKQLDKSSLNLVITAREGQNIVMIEGWADNLDQKKFIDGLKYGTTEVARIINAMKKSNYASNLSEVKYESEYSKAMKNPKLYDTIKLLSYMKIKEVFTDYSHDKKSRDDALNKVRAEAMTEISNYPDLKDVNPQITNEMFTRIIKDVYKNIIFEEDTRRCDGRKLDQLRPISCKVGLFERLHGSSLFQRGQTQVLCTLTFDSVDAMYNTDAIETMISPSLTKFDKNFMLHYDFPPFATNEVARASGYADRREIGHGALAEKAIYPILPQYNSYTTRLLCEVLESNGSSSMASVCAGSLALWDAGVDIIEPVCGVAMGLLTKTNYDNKITDHRVLTDISGLEDYYGDMDFKVAGTKDGITALQADIKIDGLPIDTAVEALEKSKAAREHILEIMNNTISKKREDRVENLPKSKEIEIPVQKRGTFLGIGGMNIKKIETKTGCTITPLAETKFLVFGPNAASFTEAMELIDNLLEQQKEPELEFNGVYTAKIVEIVESGVMVQLYPTMKPALLPNSQIDNRKIHHGTSSGLKVGQEIQVKYFGRDQFTGSMRLSRKVLFMSTPRVKSLLNKTETAEK